MRICLLDPGLKDVGGHHLDVDLRLALGFQARGHNVTVHGAVDVAAAATEQISIHPTFRVSPYVGGLPDTPAVLLRAAAVTAEDLATVPDADMWLWPTLVAHQAVATLSRGDVPAVGGIWFPPRFQCTWESQMWARATRLGEGNRLLLGVYHDATADLYRKVIPDGRWMRFPAPYDGAPGSPRTALRSIGILGHARAEKGSALVEQLVRSLLARGYQVTVQGMALPFDSPALRLLTYVDDFAVEVARHDLVIWPARAASYRFRHSGVVAQALVQGVPLVVPAGCAPAEDVIRAECGVLFREFTADAVLCAVDEAAREYPRLAQAARRAADLGQATEGTERLIDTILAWRSQARQSVPAAAARHLDLTVLEKSLLRFDRPDAGTGPHGRLRAYDPLSRLLGRDLPTAALTMGGLVRLRQLRALIGRVLQEGVPGDLLEAGVWRGGSAIYQAAVLADHGVTDRRLVLADSFGGYPGIDAHYFAVPLEEVQTNFASHGHLGSAIVFLPGWFAHTLESAPVSTLALVHVDVLDGPGTRAALNALYERVSPGGVVMVSGYETVPACRAAVDQYRRTAWIQAPLIAVDGSAVYWRKPVSGTEPAPSCTPPQQTLWAAGEAFARGDFDTAVRLAACNAELAGL